MFLIEQLSCPEVLTSSSDQNCFPNGLFLIFSLFVLKKYLAKKVPGEGKFRTF